VYNERPGLTAVALDENNTDPFTVDICSCPDMTVILPSCLITGGRGTMEYDRAAG